MNNRYLYRAKRIDNGGWVEGYLLNIAKINAFICTGKIKLDEAIKGYVVPEMYAVDPSTICMRVPCGGCSLDGNPIWENDIVKNRHYTGIVKYGLYENTHLGFYIEWLNGCEILRKDFVYWLPRIKSIGNIFDNPELMEQE